MRTGTDGSRNRGHDGMGGQLQVEAATPHRTIGEEADPLARTVVDDAVAKGLPEKGIEAVLYGGDRCDGRCELDLVYRDVREPDAKDLPLFPQTFERPNAVLERHAIVRRVELVQGDCLDVQRLQGTLACGSKVLRSPVRFPATARPSEPAFRCDEYRRAIPTPRRHGLSDQPFVVPYVVITQAIHVGRVDQRNTRVERRVDDALRLRFVRTSRDRQMHAAVPDGRDREAVGRQLTGRDHANSARRMNPSSSSRTS